MGRFMGFQLRGLGASVSREDCPQAMVEPQPTWPSAATISELTFHGLAFTSRMAGRELHGAIEGFTSHDLTDAVRGRNPAGNDDAT